MPCPMQIDMNKNSVNKNSVLSHLLYETEYKVAKSYKKEPDLCEVGMRSIPISEPISLFFLVNKFLTVI